MIPFANMKRHHALLREEITQAVGRVLDSGWYVLGREVEAFEASLASYVDTKYCVGVASGTDAITLALMSLDIGSGDEVITTSLTAYPTITGIQRSGATPVPIDVLSETGLLNPEMIEQQISKKTKAIIPVHLYGQSCDMERIAAVAYRYDIPVVEDCAQSIGATCQGRKTGGWGALGCFSFYPTKNLGAYGDGGAITTDSKALFEKLLMLRNYGQADRYRHQYCGLNSRLDEVQAAILSIKLVHLDAWNKRRCRIADIYKAEIKTVESLKEEGYGRSVYHLYVIKTRHRDAFMQHMNDAGVQTLIHYPVPVHRQAAAANMRAKSSYPCAEELAGEIVSLPMYPELSDAEVETVINAANSTPGSS